MVVTNKIVPGLLGRMLAKKAWGGQFTDEEVSTERPNNLHQPVDRDSGTHGPFEAKAKPRSLQVQLSTHRNLVALIGVAALVLAGVLSARSRR